MKRYIVVRTQREGFHRWPNAPKQVGFLKNLHRHIFKIEVQIPVTHNDRELEYFIVQRKLNEFLTKVMHKLDESASCELIAESLGELLIQEYELPLTVTVSEDGENGSVVVFDEDDVFRINAKVNEGY